MALGGDPEDVGGVGEDLEAGFQELGGATGCIEGDAEDSHAFEDAVLAEGGLVHWPVAGAGREELMGQEDEEGRVPP